MYILEILNFPTEIRLKIYSLLLVSPSPVFLIHLYNNDFWPALLRVNKHIYHEAIALLYSNNRFYFFEISSDGRNSADLTLFIRKIGGNYKLVHHICLEFPKYPLEKGHKPEYVENLEHIQRALPSLKTLEWHNCELYKSGHEPTAEHATENDLALVEQHLKAIPSLEKVIAKFELRPRNSCDKTMEIMRGLGWTIQVKMLPPKKWVSEEDGMEFSDEEDFLAHMIPIWKAERYSGVGVVR